MMEEKLLWHCGIGLTKAAKSGFALDLQYILAQNAMMEEKLCLKWNEFQENVTSALGDLRSDEDFTDVTLAC